MKRLLLLIPLGLAACASPQERCISQAQRNLNVVNNLITVTRGNIERGYAIEERQEVRTVNRVCSDELDSGEVVRVRCQQVITEDVNVPVAIDLNAETAKLESLIERRDALQASVGSAIAQCQAQYPET